MPERIRGSAHLRAAKFGGKIYLDIGDPEWQAIEIDASGWRMIQDSPVRFRRTVGMAALPLPERGGSITQLRSLVNSDVQLRRNAVAFWKCWLRVERR